VGWSVGGSVVGGSVVGGSVVGGSVVGGAVVGGSVVGGSVVGGAVVGGSVVGGAVVGSAVVGSGPDVVGATVCPGAVVWPGAVVVFWVEAVVALAVPVAVAVAFGPVSVPVGSWAVSDADADGPVDCAEPDDPLAGTDDDALLGKVAQVDTFGAGASALLAAATTPRRPNAPTLPSRPTRRVLDCTAYQSRILSALILKKACIPRGAVNVASIGAWGGSGRAPAFAGPSFSAARRGRSALTADPPRSLGTVPMSTSWCAHEV
jgi:hypothetical protein